MTQRFVGGYTLEFEGNWTNFVIHETVFPQDFSVPAYDIEHSDGSRRTQGTVSLETLKGYRDWLTSIIDTEERRGED